MKELSEAVMRKIAGAGAVRGVRAPWRVLRDTRARRRHLVVPVDRISRALAVAATALRAAIARMADLPLVAEAALITSTLRAVVPVQPRLAVCTRQAAGTNAKLHALEAPRMLVQPASLFGVVLSDDGRAVVDRSEVRVGTAPAPTVEAAEELAAASRTTVTLTLHDIIREAPPRGHTPRAVR